jgi:hypothetical protein
MYIKRKQLTFRSIIRLGASLVLVCLVLVANTASAISRGYATTDEGLKTGMVVRLSSSGDSAKPSVERASSDNPNQMLGVTRTPDESIVTIASGEKQVYVESTGEVDVYVSDLDGEVKEGDFLTLSPLKGILTKATEGSRVVVGQALEDFSGKTKEPYTITADGKEKTVQVALVRVTLDRKATPQDTHPDSSLKRLGRSLVGKDVNELRIIIALVIFFIVVVSTGGILYGAITSAITAFGRNPLAKSIIRRELVRVIIVALVVILVGLLAVYAVLWI